MGELHPAVELTVELVKINSENPTNVEKEITDFITNWLNKEKIEYQLQEVSPGRSNIIAKVPGKGEREPIVFIAHCDTVPVGQGWTYDPLGGEIVEGKLYGRGAADMKSGLAAALYAIKEAKGAKSLPGDIIVVVSVDEEGPGMLGISAILQSGLIKENTMVIAPEPTNLDIIRAHRGVMWYEIIAHGRSSHGGHAERGIDANHALAEIICELKTSVGALQFDEKPLISVGQMGGGEKTNVVPNIARAEIDFRVVFPMNVEDANQLVNKAAQRAVQRVEGATVDVLNLGLQRPPLIIPEDASIIKLLQKSFIKVMEQEPVLGGYVAYTDAAVVSLKLNNKNAVCFGPGNLEQAHAYDEWVSIKEIELCGEIFKTLVYMEP